MSNSSKNSSGVTFLSMLGLLFIGLKLGKVIAWSWWLVLLPLYGPITILIGVCMLVLIGRLGAVATTGIADKRRLKRMIREGTE